MKYSITEEKLNNVITTLNKKNVDRGELGSVIEELVKYRVGENLCDVAAIKIKEDFYVVIGLTTIFYSENYVIKLAEFIENFVGVYPNIIFNETKNCKKIKED